MADDANAPMALWANMSLEYAERMRSLLGQTGPLLPSGPASARGARGRRRCESEDGGNKKHKIVQGKFSGDFQIARSTYLTLFSGHDSDHPTVHKDRICTAVYMPPKGVDKVAEDVSAAVYITNKYTNNYSAPALPYCEVIESPSTTRSELQLDRAINKSFSRPRRKGTRERQGVKEASRRMDCIYPRVLCGLCCVYGL